ncbi:hypothetical protein ACFOEZ_19935 [Tianweitania populi]|uniref:DUF2884 family protein n=1 Tax=Tianweitania populi TaxID=1607949 RepID=A0A8J3DZ12_9HYPH|nr:hypothetical protein [Tianweitania populi]GHD21346.1 hypothetical protein GCM10016234_34900 [Tianweitania populi]
MAGITNTTRFACVTRRVALWGIAAAAAAPQSASANALNHISLYAAAPTDPVASLWREWEAVHERVQHLSRRMQELEIELAERTDCLGMRVTLPGEGPVLLYSHEALDRLVGDRTDVDEIRRQAAAELDERQARFEAVADDVEYFSTMKAEQGAFKQAEALLDAMAITQAASLAGVANKLEAVSRWGAAWDEHPKEFPWPQIRSAHQDLVRLVL